MRKFLLLFENNEFIIILHACPHCLREFQWCIADGADCRNLKNIENQTYESISLSSEIIRDKYNQKWIYGKHKHNEEWQNGEAVLLSDNFIDIIRNNQFDNIAFFGTDGNIRTDVEYGNYYE